MKIIQVKLGTTAAKSPFRRGIKNIPNDPYLPERINPLGRVTARFLREQIIMGRGTRALSRLYGFSRNKLRRILALKKESTVVYFDPYIGYSPSILSKIIGSNLKNEK